MLGLITVVCAFTQLLRMFIKIHCVPKRNITWVMFTTHTHTPEELSGVSRKIAEQLMKRINGNPFL
jgi:hypothetical protein